MLIKIPCHRAMPIASRWAQHDTIRSPQVDNNYHEVVPLLLLDVAFLDRRTWRQQHYDLYVGTRTTPARGLQGKSLPLWGVWLGGHGTRQCKLYGENHPVQIYHYILEIVANIFSQPSVRFNMLLLKGGGPWLLKKRF